MVKLSQFQKIKSSLYFLIRVDPCLSPFRTSRAVFLRQLDKLLLRDDDIVHKYEAVSRFLGLLQSGRDCFADGCSSCGADLRFAVVVPLDTFRCGIEKERHQPSNQIQE